MSLRTILTALVALAVGRCGVDVDVDGTHTEAPPRIDVVSAGLSSINCDESTDTGYTKGKAFSIVVVTVDGKKTELATANAYYVMAKAAAAAGVNIKVVSGFRTMAEQQYFYNCYVNCSCNNCNLAAKPGYSNHQSGHALDLNTSAGGVYNWLDAHAGAYGFKRTVPSEKWHWEWWGGGPGGGPCGKKCECQGGQVQSKGCGLCGTSTRSCDGCNWGGWSGCKGEGTCSPGESQTKGCGNCGQHTRTCSAGCLWKDYGACQGEGPCAPGQTEAAQCGECGFKERVCSPSCQMGDYGKCTWLDPDGGTKACDTSLEGQCALGQLKCLSGTIACVGTVAQETEVCDGLDNDCDGESDEAAKDGAALALGAVPPAFASAAPSAEAPATLEVESDGIITLRFTNAGTEPWPAGLVVVRAAGPAPGEPSPLRHPDWPGLSTAVLLSADVAPGAEAVLTVPVRAPAEPGRVVETLRLVHTSVAEAFRCPSPEVTVVIDVVPAPAEIPEVEPPAEEVPRVPVPVAPDAITSTDPDTGAAPRQSARTPASGDCTAAGRSQRTALALTSLAMLLLLAFRRRAPG